MRMILPQGQFAANVKSTDTILLVAGGRMPNPAWLSQVALNYPIWAADRGVDACRTAGVRPERLFGDADSASGDAWKWAEQLRVPVARYPADKDRTDLQLALEAVGVHRPGAAVLVTGALGRRFDHAFSNVFSLLEAEHSGVTAIGLADDAEFLLLLRAGQVLIADFTLRPEIISLLPLSPICGDVCSQGLHWPLSGATLRMDAPGGLSNRLAVGAQLVSVSLGSGCLGVYFCWEERSL